MFVAFIDFLRNAYNPIRLTNIIINSRKTMLLKNNAPSDDDINEFLSLIKFRLPEGFIEFYRETNGADISTEENYYILWPITSEGIMPHFRKCGA